MWTTPDVTSSAPPYGVHGPWGLFSYGVPAKGAAAVSRTAGRPTTPPPPRPELRRAGDAASAARGSRRPSTCRRAAPRPPVRPAASGTRRSSQRPPQRPVLLPPRVVPMHTCPKARQRLAVRVGVGVSVSDPLVFRVVVGAGCFVCRLVRAAAVPSRRRAVGGSLPLRQRPLLSVVIPLPGRLRLAYSRKPFNLSEMEEALVKAR